MSSAISQTALLIVDVQQGPFERSRPIYSANELLDTIARLVDRARAADAPVVYIQHENNSSRIRGSEAWRLHPRLHPADGGLIIHKRHGNAFEKTSLDAELKRRGVSRLVVTGLVTQGCVKATCIGDKELGYQITLVRDGHSNMNVRAAETVEKWNRKLSDCIAELQCADELSFSEDSP